MSSRNWCFTINNPTNNELQFNDNVRFCVWQKERGTEGTEHLQGYIELRSPRRLSYLKSLFERGHFETRKGTRQQAIDYCKKEDSRIEGPWIHGEENSRQGERTDLDEIKRKIDQGATESTIADEHFAVWCRNFRAFERYKRIKTTNRTWNTDVTMLIGPPGCGKSKYCIDKYPDAYWKQRSEWWDGYDGNDSVVLDDFYGWIPFDTLLRVMDRYPLLVETKGGQTNFLAKSICITSNKWPTKWYKNGDIRALFRRVEKWIVWNERGNKMEFENGQESEAYSHFIDTINII